MENHINKQNFTIFWRFDLIVSFRDFLLLFKKNHIIFEVWYEITMNKHSKNIPFFQIDLTFHRNVQMRQVRFAAVSKWQNDNCHRTSQNCHLNHGHERKRSLSYLFALRGTTIAQCVYLNRYFPLNFASRWMRFISAAHK